MNKNILITGSSGFYGEILFNYLLKNKFNVIGLDITYIKSISKTRQILCDLTNFKDLRQKLINIEIEIIIHLASQIDFSVSNQKSLFKNNIKSTKNICKLAEIKKIKKIIFTSSNSIFLGQKKDIIYKDDYPIPIDMYGKSKVISERILQKYQNKFHVNILRCPIIIDSGRLGMLTILFEIIRSNAILWVLDGGKIKHHMLYADDLTKIIIKLLEIKKSMIINLASGKADTFYNIFAKVINENNSKSKIISLPSKVIIPLLKFLFFLKLSPLGPYQFRMLTQNFEFDLNHLKKEIKLNNSTEGYKALSIAYKHYIKNKNKISKNNSNKSRTNFGLLEILKYIKI